MLREREKKESGNLHKFARQITRSKAAGQSAKASGSLEDKKLSEVDKMVTNFIVLPLKSQY